MNGKFIVLEGIDANGKHTQAKILKERLEEKGLEVVVTEEPQYGDNIGGFIRKWLKGEFQLRSKHAITLLYVADRYEHVEKIRQWLSSGKWVISARYYHSTYAFQGGYYGISKEWLECLHEYCPKSDLTIVIDITPEESLRRKSDERYEKLEIQRKVREEYLKMVENGMAEMVDGMKSVEEVAEEIWKKVEKLMR